MMEKPSRIGLFGGTFNPVHYGHLRAAREAVEALCLERLVLIPAAQPPHKLPGDVAPAPARLEMLHRATVNCPDFDVSDVELQRNGLSYSIDTLAVLQTRLPAASQLYWIMGLDAFLEIHTWKAWQELLDRVALVILDRPQPYLTPAQDATRMIQVWLQQHFPNQYVYQGAASSGWSCFQRVGCPSLGLLTITRLDISATRIRHLIRQGRSIQFLVPPSVAAYIQDQGLYHP